MTLQDVSDRPYSLAEYHHWLFYQLSQSICLHVVRSRGQKTAYSGFNKVLLQKNDLHVANMIFAGDRCHLRLSILFSFTQTLVQLSR